MAVISGSYKAAQCSRLKTENKRQPELALLRETKTPHFEQQFKSQQENSFPLLDQMEKDERSGGKSSSREAAAEQSESL